MRGEVYELVDLGTVTFEPTGDGRVCARLLHGVLKRRIVLRSEPAVDRRAALRLLFGKMRESIDELFVEP